MRSASAVPYLSVRMEGFFVSIALRRWKSGGGKRRAAANMERAADENLQLFFVWRIGVIDFFPDSFRSCGKALAS